MAVPVKMSDLATLAASNSPQGSDAIGNSLDDFLRALSAIVRSTNALSSASVAAGSTTDIGSSDAEQVAVTGTATITSLGTTAAGIKREVIFVASGSVLTNSAAIALPNGANITVTAGDVYQFRSLGSGNWRMVGPRTQLAISDITGLQTALNLYLPLTGGSLTGALSSNSAISTSSTIAATGNISSGGTVSGNLVTANTGAVTSTGTGAGITFTDRANAGLSWTWFAASTNANLFSASAGSVITINYTTGNTTVTGTWTGPNFIATSDRRKKKAIKKREARQDLADRLNFVSFTWKKDNRPDLGVIADQVRDVAPEYVYEGEDGFLGVDKAMLALEAVIGLAARVRALEGR